MKLILDNVQLKPGPGERQKPIHRGYTSSYSERVMDLRRDYTGANGSDHGIDDGVGEEMALEHFGLRLRTCFSSSDRHTTFKCIGKQIDGYVDTSLCQKVKKRSQNLSQHSLQSAETLYL